MAAFYTPNTMKVIQGEPPCLKWFRRMAPTEEIRKGLFLYVHQETMNIMLGKWITLRGVFTPLLQIGKEMSDFTEKTQGEFISIFPKEKTPRQLAHEAKSNHESETDELRDRQIERRAKLLRDELRIKGVKDNGSVFLPDSILRQ